MSGYNVLSRLLSDGRAKDNLDKPDDSPTVEIRDTRGWAQPSKTYGGRRSGSKMFFKVFLICAE
jgi:hypothetical protein